MAETAIRFHLDESVRLTIVRPLGERGIDVTTPADAGLLEATDEEHLEFARAQDRVLVTHDTDFLRLNSEETPASYIAIKRSIRPANFSRRCCWFTVA